MTGDSCEAWGRLRELTDALLVAAQADDWERVADLEARRRPLLQTYFGSLPEPDAVPARCQAQWLLDVEDRLMDLARRRRDWLGRELQRLGQARAAVMAYQHCS